MAARQGSSMLFSSPSEPQGHIFLVQWGLPSCVHWQAIPLGVLVSLVNNYYRFLSQAFSFVEDKLPMKDQHANKGISCFGWDILRSMSSEAAAAAGVWVTTFLDFNFPFCKMELRTISPSLLSLGLLSYPRRWDSDVSLRLTYGFYVKIYY